MSYFFFSLDENESWLDSSMVFPYLEPEPAGERSTIESFETNKHNKRKAEKLRSESRSAELTYGT